MRSPHEINTATSASHGLTLTEIAHRLGYADSSHLTRNFRSLMGFLPSDVRNGSLMRVVQAPSQGAGTSAGSGGRAL